MNSTGYQLNDLLLAFKTVFQGRTDVVPKFWATDKAKGYTPICTNLWQKGICPKSTDKTASCKRCQSQQYAPLTDDMLIKHFEGSHILGVYPLLPDNTCHFIAADFDDHEGNGKAELLVNIFAYHNTCTENQIPCHVLQSKSGNGFHAYIFFEDAVPAWKARLVAGELLNRALMLDVLGKSSFDRFFPNQDELQGGKELGNLISLPFQGKASKQGHTLFLDIENDFRPFSDQIEILKNISSASEADLDRLIAEWGLKRERNESLSCGSRAADGAEAGTILQCDFLKWCKDNPSDVSEPLWLAMISNLCRITPGGLDICHEFSKGHPKYSYSEAEEKIRHVLNDIKPITCARIRNDGFPCGKSCGVKSPIVLINKKSKTAGASESTKAAKERVSAVLTDAFTRKDNVIEAIKQDSQCMSSFAILAQSDSAFYEASMKELSDSGVATVEIEELKKEIDSKIESAPHLRLVGPDEKKGPVKLKEILGNFPFTQDLVVPSGWEISDKGAIEKVTWEKDRQGNYREERVPICRTPVIISERLTSIEDGQEEVKISWLEEGKWKHKIFERKTIAVRNEITALANYGVPVTSLNASGLIAYLSDFEDANINLIPRTKVSGHMGWQSGQDGFLIGDKFFVSEQESIVPVTFKGYEAGNNQIANGFTKRGSYRDWVAGVNQLFQYPIAISSLYFSLAAPFLEIIGAPNFIVDWSNPTSTGKTTTLRIAGSCWGNPDERSESATLFSWDNTKVAIERTAMMLNGLPLILDDTKLAGTGRRNEKAAEVVSHVVYMVTNGRGRGRGSKNDGLRSTGSWKTILLSSGEQPIVDFTRDGGSRGRVISLWAGPFKAADAKTAAVVREANLTMKANFGHAGPMLIDFILRKKNDWPLWETEYHRLIGYFGNKAGNNPVAGRIGDFFAVLAAVIPIVHAAMPELRRDFPPKAIIDPLWDVAVRQRSIEDLDQAKAALQYVYSWALSNAASFFERGDAARPPHNGWAGEWDIVDDWTYIAFYPQRLEKILSENGWEAKATIGAWYDRRWLDHDKDRWKKLMRSKSTGERIRFYCLNRSAIEEELGILDETEEN
jgi:uncharacterized protein (DUF927 family)